MKITEAMRNHPYRTATAAALMLGLTVEAVGFVKNPTYDIPEGACLSPPAVSAVYAEPGTNLLLQTQTGLFAPGVVAHGMVPKGAYGVVPSFRHPEAGEHAWEENAGPMTKANDAGHYAIKFAIGPREVEFGAQIVAPAGSELCDTPPEVTHEYFDRIGFMGADGTVAVPNPANIFFNVANAP